MPPTIPQANDSLDITHPIRTIKNLLTRSQYFWFIACLILIGDATLCRKQTNILKPLQDTEIDFETYMIQTDLYLAGERDYSQITGPTGPLVYPAGHVHIHHLLHNLTQGGSLKYLPKVQELYAGLYLLTMALTFLVYRRAGIPQYVLLLLPLSKRLHSIYVLRLFNDCWSTPLSMGAIHAFQKRYWAIGCILFGCVISSHHPFPASNFSKQPCHQHQNERLAIYACGLPGSTAYQRPHPFALVPLPNVPRSLDTLSPLSRNIPYGIPRQRIRPESTIPLQMDRQLAVRTRAHIPKRTFCQRTPILPHYSTRNIRVRRMVQETRWRMVRSRTSSAKSGKGDRDSDRGSDIATVFFTANLIGILCARSLHYQFYSWYATQLPLLAWRTKYPIALRIMILGIIEYAWNTYPSTDLSSGLLLAAHVLLLIGVLFGYPEGTNTSIVRWDDEIEVEKLD
ncbi:ALG3 domain-containing protein [Rhizoctonia solani AG-1 IA]|uniref:Dol-P-Man:Man(5)GlcNAc(2)-PP-Dol alpha-1,3-mannosyltransferase n=1 Tax=Thanatephorus cucumeris (strain AG1-IA) TaxID=983506 RepID=L8WS08_THACA|nr:ALG3 domain-containing protein [Rhizoctonia solani AG-1 IA]